MERGQGLHLRCDAFNVSQREEFSLGGSPVKRGAQSSLTDKFADRLPKFVLDDTVSQLNLLLELLDNAVALLDVQLSPVLTALLVQLLHEEFVLVRLLGKLGDLA